MAEEPKFPIEREAQIEIVRMQYDFAKFNAEKDPENFKIEQTSQLRWRVSALRYMLATLALILGFCLIAMHWDKDAIALEIVKAGIFMSAGGGLGYAIGRRPKK